MSPSTLPVFARGSASRLAQKARVAANEMRADHRSAYAEVAALLAVAGAARALQRASWRTNPAASALQRPPTSRASTVRRERADRQSSGYVRSLAWRAKRNAAPVVQPRARRRQPSVERPEWCQQPTEHPPRAGVRWR